MLEGTPIWTPGSMHLWVNNKPAHVYVPKSNPKEAFEVLQSRLSTEGRIPIGIDHLPDNIIKANPILAKLNLLDVGSITEIEYTDDAIKIVEAELTNPLILDLYQKGELEMVSIVATSTTSECQQNSYDYILDTTDITRVDIVEKGACTLCNIPKPQSSDDTVVYARYSIQTNRQEEPLMADEAITMDAIKETINEAIAPLDERLTAIEEAVKIDEEESEETDETVEELKARLAKIEEESAKEKEAATIKAAEAIVDMAIMAGKRTPAQRESEIKLCAADSEAYKETIKNSEVIVSLDERISLLAGDSEEDDDDSTLTPEEENLNAVLNHFGGDE